MSAAADDSTGGDDDRIDALLRSQFGLMQMLATLPDRLIAVDRALRIRFLISPDAPLDPLDSPAHGRPVSEFVPDGQREPLLDWLDAVFDRGVSGSYEVEATTLAGARRWFHASVAPVLDEDGEPLLAVILTRDVTELHQQREQLALALEREREAVERLRELDELKSGFVANVVHDLRTPITVIRGFAETLDQRWDEFDDSERQQFLRFMVDGTQRLMRLVDDIMLVSRLESGDLPLQKARFDLAAIASTVATELGHGQAVAIEVEAPDVATACGDSLRIRQVFVNLVANALRYSPEDRPVEIRIREEAGHWLASVEDRGPGIAPEDQPRLFRRFSQLDPEAGGHGGSGLGLYICRSIVEAHGGEIGVDSAVGDGSRFWFTVPLGDDC